MQLAAALALLGGLSGAGHAQQAADAQQTAPSAEASAAWTRKDYVETGRLVERDYAACAAGAKDAGRCRNLLVILIRVYAEAKDPKKIEQYARLLLAQNPVDRGTRATALEALAQAMEAQKRVAEAEPYFRAWLKLLAPDDNAPFTAREQVIAAAYLRKNLTAQGKYAEAVSLQERRVPAIAAQLGEGSAQHRFAQRELATVYTRAERYADAEPLLVLLAAEAERGGKPAERVNAVDALTENLFYQVDGLYREGKRAAWATAAARLVELRRQATPFEPRALGKALFYLGLAKSRLRQMPEAVAHLREALDLERAAGGGETLALSDIQHEYGYLLIQQGRDAEAEIPLRHALQIRQAKAGAAHHDTWESYDLLTTLLDRTGRRAEALALLRAGLAAARTSGSDVVLTEFLNRLARLADTSDEGEVAAREAVERATRAWGAVAGRTLDYRRTLASVLRERGHLDDARQIIDGVLADARKRYGERSLAVIDALNAKAAILHDEGHDEESERTFAAAIAISADLYGTDAPRTLDLQTGLASIWIAQGRYAEATQLYRMRIAKLVGRTSERDTELLGLRMLLAASLWGGRDYDGAAAEFAELRRIYRAMFGAGHIEELRQSLWIANTDIVRDRHAAGLRALNPLIATLETKIRKASDAVTDLGVMRDAYQARSIVYRRQRQFPRALRDAEAASRVQRRMTAGGGEVGADILYDVAASEVWIPGRERAALEKFRQVTRFYDGRRKRISAKDLERSGSTYFDEYSGLVLAAWKVAHAKR